MLKNNEVEINGVIYTKEEVTEIFTKFDELIEEIQSIKSTLVRVTGVDAE